MISSTKRKILLAAAFPLLLLCLCAPNLPVITGTAHAELHLSGDDDKKIKAWCKSKLPKNASRLNLGACYEGYVLGFQNKSNSTCDTSYKGHSGAIHYCKTTGYNGGKNNSAKISKGSGGGGGGGGGGSTNGGAETCGDSPGVSISIGIGCRGKGNPIADMVFAIIRVLSAGVGLVVVGSIVVGGIQYSASRGDPQSTAMAVNRIRSSVFALLIYIFGYALLNYVIPGAILQ